MEMLLYIKVSCLLIPVKLVPAMGTGYVGDQAKNRSTAEFNFMSDFIFPIYLTGVIVLLYLLYGNRVQRLGEAGLVYGWISIMLMILISLLATTLILLNRSQNPNLAGKSPQGTMMIIVLIAISLLCTAICSLFRFQEQPPGWFFKSLCFVIPIINLINLTFYMTIMLFGRQNMALVLSARYTGAVVVVENLIVLLCFYFAYRLESRSEKRTI